MGVAQKSMGVARAEAEITLCEHVLAKSGLNILSETLRDASRVETWSHYPAGDVYDPQSGAQWYYHCHPAEEGEVEHGHFHCFVRPHGADGPVHHLVAMGVDANGALLRLFTVNQWVVDDDWLEATPTIGLLERFDVQMPRPSYLVNRWLTAIVLAYEQEIAALIRARDVVLTAHIAPEGIAVRQDRDLEVLSEYRID